jgi:glycosyltransferase involved in cell wall biosynthesis
MAALVWLTRRNATHVFLCSCMERDFLARYGGQIRSKRLANAAFVDVPSGDAPLRAPEGHLMVGLLSNLSDEKGLYRFLKLAEEAVGSGLPATFILAGPTTNERDASAIARTANRLKDHFQYRGALYGDARSAFYRDVDIFAFPTGYDNEAQPLVLYEAMAHGAAVVSVDRGCIAEQVGDAGWVVPKESDFVRVCLDLLWRLSGDETTLLNAQTSARLRMVGEHEAALEAANDLFGNGSAAVVKDTRSASGCDLRTTGA